MAKKVFLAEHWLQKEVSPVKERLSFQHEKEAAQTCEQKALFRTFIRRPGPLPKIQISDRFSPVHCFVPGWQGDSLSSKDVIKFDRLLSLVQNDVKTELFKTKDFPRSIKIGLYNEFLSFAESLGLHFEGLDDLSRFWQMIDPEKLQAEGNERLAQFIDLYANRVTTITFFKLRFISTLLETCQLEINDKALLYPTAFLSQIFKSGSHTELQSRALESNLYSWYRPHEGMKEAMKELLIISRDLAITEIIKNVSQRTQVTVDQNKVYSHALSHLSLGLFMNSLQINYPMWLETVEGRTLPSGALEQERIISCKYFGDYLESLSLSHWLAQENNKTMRWDEILCPDFKGLEFINGAFTKVCNELQFLTFLAQKAEHQGVPPIEYICRTIGGHFRNRKGTSPKQGLLLEDNPFYTSTYDRVVLNLCQFPKNNPQHYLMAQISDQVKYLKPNGYLFVLSSKKLFVPSLRERLEPVLSELKTEAIFDLENVKGKGELGSYIYIFRKKHRQDHGQQQCSYFRISADLSSFQEFSSITEHLRSFYLSHLTEMPAMAHLDFPDSFRIEFFQEAVVNGMLIHSTNEDSSRITHPAFFKGLLDSCVPMDMLFEIRALTSEDTNMQRDVSLNLGLKRDVSYFLVVDFRGQSVNLELHPMNAFRSIHSDYGETQCCYFQLLPKITGLNPNVLRNYFVTPIGNQVANLTFSGGPSLVKGNLSKFLVPKFFMQTEALPEHIAKALQICSMTEAELLEANPQTILKSFTHVDQVTKDLFPRYANDLLSRFSNLERTLEGLTWKLNDSRYGHKVSFSNPVIQGQLVKTSTRPLYPDNDDIYFEFVDGSVATDIHSPLTSTQIQISHEGELKLYSLELLSGSRVIVRLHGEELMVLFINFIVSEAINVPIAKILRAVHVPRLQDVKAVVEVTQGFNIVYQDLLVKVRKSIMDAFRLHVTSKRGQ